MNTFIRVAEVWTPTTDGSLLEVSAGLFDAAPAFGAISRTLCFGRGEGLPGHAWNEGRPVLLKNFDSGYFRRTAAAKAAGLRCAVALPIFLDGVLTSVVVLFCGDVQAQVGAIELWHNDPRITTDLKLADGYFGATATDLEALTRDGALARGIGAPGLAWQREASVFIDNVAQSRHFLRAEVAASAGILRALALPCSTAATGMSGPADTWVLSLLASAGSPIAHRVESWQASTAGAGLRRAYGHCETLGPLPVNADGPLIPVDAGGAIATAWRSGAAQAASGAVGLSGLLPGGLPGEAGAPVLPSVLCIPVVSDGAVAEVIALYF